MLGLFVLVHFKRCYISQLLYALVIGILQQHVLIRRRLNIAECSVVNLGYVELQEEVGAAPNPGQIGLTLILFGLVAFLLPHFLVQHLRVNHNIELLLFFSFDG